MTDDDQYITVEAAAQLLGLSTRQVHRYGQGDRPRLRSRCAGRRILYHRGDVAALAKDLAIARTPLAPLPPRNQPSPPPPSPLLPALGDRPDPLTVGELISLQEAAEYAGLAKKSLQNYAIQGRLRAKKLGPVWVTTRVAVDEYLASRSLDNIPKKYRDFS